MPPTGEECLTAGSQTFSKLRRQPSLEYRAQQCCVLPVAAWADLHAAEA